MIHIKDEAVAIADDVIALRRYFHMHPELGMQEYETSAKIKEELEKLNISYKNCGETGVIAQIGTGKKLIALRADMDALSIQEKSGVSYASVNDGVMHACGHDAHTAALLGAARILKAHEAELKVGVRLLFQPSEENCKGGRFFCENGALDGVDEVYGIHIFTDVAVGNISIEAGPRMASTSSFKVKITGRAGHGAKPQQCVDATVAACACIMNLQTIISRETDPVDSAVVTVGSLKSGSQYNIISGEAVFEGTVRAFSEERAEHIEASLKRIVNMTAEAYGAKADVVFLRSQHPGVINDAALTERLTEKAKVLFGKDRLCHVPPMMLGEDFSFYQQTVPGVFMFAGGGNPEIGCGYPNHHDCFNIDERVLTDSVMLHLMAVCAAEEALGGNEND